MTTKRQVTIKELLTAISAAAYHQRSFLHFIPTRTEHLKALKKCKRLGYVTPLVAGGTQYKLTRKGTAKLLSYDADRLKPLDDQIDKFVDQL